MSYSRTYENISLNYSLPSRNFHPSKILEDYVNEIATQYCISKEEVIDAYVKVYLNELGKNVTKMISHDGNMMLFHKYRKKDLIIDNVVDEDEVAKRWIKTLLRTDVDSND